MYTESFWEWFNRERELRNLSVRAVERLGGVGISTIGGKERQGLPPTFDICKAIARAFQMPTEDVLRRAGLLPHRPDEDPLAKELFYYFEQLDEDAQRHIIAAARGIAEAEAKYKAESEPPRETKKQH